jgi:predicted negative regulator of RcsB-dependent stress response
MKSAHRHELETNVLAHRLESFIERAGPYVPKVIAGIVTVVVLMLIWSYVSGSSASRSNEAWDSYNYAIGAQPMNMELLHQAAEANPGTQMQQSANVTWADSQAMQASHNYIYNRSAANKALEQAASAYQGVIQSSDDERLLGRARLGLARVYEMQNSLDKARAEYEQVTGPYATYAKAQAERLAKPEAKETYAWLATAEPPRPKAPMGPGTPGQKPEFSPGDLSLPGASDTGATNSGDAKTSSEVYDKLFNDLQGAAKADENGDRYNPDQPPATDSNPAAPGSTPATGDAKAGETPPSDEAPKGDAPPATPTDEKAAK